jgi:two-component system cell cycle sensor histidine kinase/response regulator CckA
LFEHRIIRPDGSERTVECRSRVVVDEQKIVNCVIATIQDVTETQAMERNLELAKRIGSLGRVAATIAHEFNNVMMGIEPFAEMIRRQATNDAILQAAEQISVSVRRGRRVTEEILRFTQPAEPELRGVDLREWLRDLGTELRALAGSVRVTIKLPDSPVYIACDAAQLQQVVTNLLLNARDASPEGSEITIALARVGREHIELTVRDEGSGIPPNSLEHIFEPLFTTKRTGTGLGLSVARQIVTRHGGSIEVTNVATGGAKFRIVLPATKARPTAVPQPQQQSAALHLRRILLVEDDDLVAAGLTALLEMEGMAVLVISRGLQVVDAVASFEPDAVILDLTLPDVNGIEVFRSLRRRWPHLPVVFSTGHGGSAELATELSSARVELLRKPYEIGELLSALQRIAAV